MTALTQDRNTHMIDGGWIAVPVAANAVIHAGALVAANAAGFAVPGATSATLTYLGRAEEEVNNTGGINGDRTVTVRRKMAFLFANSGGADAVGQADLGKPCYIVDDQTVARTDGSASRSPAGIVLGVEASGVWVE